MTTSFRVGFVSLAVLLAHSGLMAQGGPQDQPAYPGGAGAGAEAEDVPGRGVARISLINGDVSVRRGDSGDVIAAAINAPLVASDRVLTGPASRTELQLDGANRLRIAADSDVRMAEIEYRRYTVELGLGTITWHVSKGSGADIDINTPSVSVRPIQPGDYRITVNPDGTTQVTARTGEAEIYSPRGVERVRRGKTTLVRGDKTDPEFQTVAEIREDEWDRFNLSRDRELDRSESRQYLADDIVGAEELDNNGSWIDSAPYGRVWQPRVAAGWSPYSQGRWAWTDYYGWTWVSYDQFGWAPFHYGSWFHQPSGWCWYPGPRHARTWWRPAMVAWFGFGGVNVGVGFGNFGWVPLAPFERFRPWYGRGFYGNNRTNIYNNIRVVNNYNIVNNYRNARVNGGAHGVAAGQFGRTSGRYDRVGEANLRSAGLMQGQLPATPGRESLAFNDRRASQLTRGGYEGAFYNRRPAAAQERIPFAEQQRGIEQGTRAFSGDSSVRGGAVNAGRGPAEGGGMRGEGVRGESGRGDTAMRGGNAIMGDVSARGESGWRRVGDRSTASGRGDGGESVRGNGAVRGEGMTQRPADGNGWRRFGEPAGRSEGMRSSGESVRGGGMTNGASREGEPSMRGGNPSSGSNGWRRFGEPTGAVDSGTSRGNSAGESFRGDRQPGNSGDAALGGSPSYRQRGGSGQELPRMAEPSRDGGFGGSRERGGPSNRSDSIRVNPPVLRDRSNSGWRGGGAPSDQGGTSRGSRGGGDGQYRSAPAYGGSAPSRGGGGSFGGMRGDGGSGSSGMRGGGGSAPSVGNSGGSRGGGGGNPRGGGGRRSN